MAEDAWHPGRAADDEPRQLRGLGSMLQRLPLSDMLGRTWLFRLFAKAPLRECLGDTAAASHLRP